MTIQQLIPVQQCVLDSSFSVQLPSAIEKKRKQQDLEKEKKEREIQIKKQQAEDLRKAKETKEKKILVARIVSMVITFVVIIPLSVSLSLEMNLPEILYMFVIFLIGLGSYAFLFKILAPQGASAFN